MLSLQYSLLLIESFAAFLVHDIVSGLNGIGLSVQDALSSDIMQMMPGKDGGEKRKRENADIGGKVSFLVQYFHLGSTLGGDGKVGLVCGIG